jgi:hypothetical protein
MGRLGRDIFRRKLERFLKHSDDVWMLRLVWSVHALQSGDSDKARRYLRFPPSAETARLGDPEYVFPWNLETIVNELLATTKVERRPDRRERYLRGDRFETIRELANAVRALENAEDGIALKKHDVFVELHRGIQRQFEWQRGFANRARIYRSALLYGGPQASAYFAVQTSLGISDFMLIGFALYLGSQLSPARDRHADMSAIGVTPAMREIVLNRISQNLQQARGCANELRKQGRPTAYRGSVLRDHPIIVDPASGQLLTPLPPLLINRITSGLYLDVVAGGDKVWTEIGKRFEDYCIAYLRLMLTSHDVSGEFEYGPKKARWRSPDVLVEADGEIRLAIECKAKRMTFEARYSDNPVEQARPGYQEIAKGMFQIWRFWSHVRRGLYIGRPVADDCLGMIVTSDPWLTMAKGLEGEVVSMAQAMAAECDSEILQDDMRPVAVTLIDDLELVMQTGNDESLMAAIEEGTRGDKLGWLLSTIHRPPPEATERAYPFEDELARLLPWWVRRDEVDVLAS